MRYSQESPGAYYLKSNLKSISKSDIIFIKKDSQESIKKRSRFCTHIDSSSVHEMLIALDFSTYIRPHRHLKKVESLHVIDGEAFAVFFFDNGKIKNVLNMGDYNSKKKFYYRISEPIFHTLVILTENFVYHEVIEGPMDTSDTQFAPWSPEENQSQEVSQFKEKLFQDINRFEIAPDAN